MILSIPILTPLIMRCTVSDMGERPILVVDTCVKIDAAFERRPDSFLLVRSIVGLAEIGSVMLLETDVIRETHSNPPPRAS